MHGNGMDQVTSQGRKVVKANFKRKESRKQNVSANYVCIGSPTESIQDLITPTT
jgi:hypothetical protein